MTISAPPPSGDVELVVMRAGGAQFGVPISCVRDVVDTPPIYPVPLAPAQVFGSINMRGRIVTAIDLRTRLGMPPCAENARRMCVIVESQRDSVGEPYALLVDEIGEVVTMPAHAFAANPVTLSHKWRVACAGLYRREDSLLLMLDVDAILASDGGIPAG